MFLKEFLYQCQASLKYKENALQGPHMIHVFLGLAQHIKHYIALRSEIHMAPIQD